MNSIKTPRRVRALSFALAIALTLAFAPLTKAQNKQKPLTAEELINAVLGMVKGETLDDVFQYLRERQPVAVSAEEKKALLRDLPRASETAAGREVQRLQECQPVLSLHQRRGVIELIPFRHSEPITFTLHGALIGVSTEAMKFAPTQAALCGIVAHETAHEYLAFLKVDPLNAKDREKSHQVELFCDAIAVVTLMKLQLDPNEYMNAIAKITTHSPESRKLNSGRLDGDEATFPAPETRIELMRRVRDRFEKGLNCNYASSR